MNLKQALEDFNYKESMLGELMECVDCIRQIPVELGARPYRVFLIWTRWSGEERGEGVESLIREEEILPVPKIQEMASVQLQLLDIGMDEQGSLQVSQISPRYTENQLLGRNPDGSGIADNETFSWEVRLDKGDVSDLKKRRRFMVKGVPSFKAESLQWSVNLIRAGSDRQHDGRPG